MIFKFGAKSFLCLLTFLFLSMIVPAAMAQEAESPPPGSVPVIIVKDKTNLYTGPSGTSDPVARAEIGDKLLYINKVVIREITWYEVRVDKNTTGWVNGGMVKEGYANPSDATMPSPIRAAGGAAPGAAWVNPRDITQKYKLDEFGGNSIGIDIGGGGIVGGNLRVGGQNTHLEGGAYLRPIIVVGGNTGATVAIMGGLTSYFNPHYAKNNTLVRKHGIFFKGGYAPSELNEVLVAFGWAYESQKTPRRGFDFDLGVGYDYFSSQPDWLPDGMTGQALIYWRVGWRWFFGKG